MDEIEEEKSFKHFLEFPFDVRMVVINEMRPKDRCRFTRCSKLSQNEARKCKDYIYGLKLYTRSQYCATLYVLFSEKSKNNFRGDYTVRFSLNNDRKKYITYMIPYGVELWKTQLDNSTNLIQYAYEYVKDMLNIHQKTVKMLCLDGVRNHEFGIESLNNLESLELDYRTDIRQFISKIRKPLKELVCHSPISEKILEEYEQIYEVQDLFKVSRIDMNYAKFQKLPAHTIHIPIGKLTEENICDFIKSWQNDKMRKSFRYCRWWISHSRFDIQKLFRLLRINHNFEERQELGWLAVDTGIFKNKFEIRHIKDATKNAELYLGDEFFAFHVLNQ